MAKKAAKKKAASPKVEAPTKTTQATPDQGSSPPDKPRLPKIRSIDELRGVETKRDTSRESSRESSRKPDSRLYDDDGEDYPYPDDDDEEMEDFDDDDEEEDEETNDDDSDEDYSSIHAVKAIKTPSFNSRSRTGIPSRGGRLVPGPGHLVTNFPPTGSVKNVLDWDKFRRYWESVYRDPETRPRLKVYGYRIYPAMIEGYRQVATMEADDAKPLSIDDIKHKFGSGGYHFKINDMGAKNKSICQCNLTDRPELSDYDNFPPMLDPEYLDEDNPVNASYLKQLRIRRHRYGDMEDDSDMRQADVKRDEAISTLTDALVSATRRSEQEPSKRDPDESYKIISHAAEKAIDMVAKQAANKGQELSTADIISLAKELRGPATNPMETVAPMLELMRESAKSEKEAMRQQMDFYRGLLEKTIERQQAQAQIEAPENPRKKDGDESVLTKKLEELQQLQQAIATLGGKGSRGNPGMDWAALAPSIVQVIGPVLSTMQYLAYGFAVRAAGGVPQGQAGAGQGNPIPPPPAPPQGQGQGHGGQSGQGPAALIEPAASSIPEEHHAATAAFLESLKVPLIQYVRDPERSGYDFADWFIDWKGEPEYARLASSGPDNLIPLLQSYPPIWSEIGHRGQEVVQFVTEFCTALQTPPDQYQDQNEQDQDQDGDGDGDGDTGKPEPEVELEPEPETGKSKAKKPNLRRKKAGEG